MIKLKDLLKEGATGWTAPLQAKSQRNAIKEVEQMIKDDSIYGGDYGNLNGAKFVGKTTEDKLDRLGQRQQDRYAVVGVVDGQYWLSMYARV